MRVVMVVIIVLMAWRLTNWKNRKEYYPTVLFMISVNLLSTIVTYNHRLWVFLPSGFLATHIQSNLFETYTVFPAAVFMYLSHFPQQRIARICYILAWIPSFLLIEVIMHIFGLVAYENGWSLAWSAAFDCVMFPLLWIHYLSPVWAWLLSGVFILFIWHHFGFTFEMLK